MRFNRLDLNLLVALDALLAEQSVSKAGEKVNLSQSAMSAALRRLREFFKDDLFVTVGRQTLPTALALELAEPVRKVLLDVQNNVIQRRPFDPATTERTFNIAASDYVIRVFLPELGAHLARIAPGFRLEIWPLTGRDVLKKFAVGEIDLLFCPDSVLMPHLPHALLFKEDFVVVADSNNPHLNDGLTRAIFEELGHVVVRLGPYRTAMLDEQIITEAGVTRRVEVAVGGFDHVAEFVVGTERLGMLHRRLALRRARRMPLALHSLPFPAVQVVEAMQWHAHSEVDPAHSWLRKTISDWIFAETA